MVIIITPKEFWHHHEAKALHADDEQHEEDCAVCQFTFSGFLFTDATITLQALIVYQSYFAKTYTFVSAMQLIAHSGLAPPKIA